MPSIGGMNISRGGMGGRKSKKESGGEFWRRFQGAVDKGYGRSTAAAIAASEAVQRLREAIWPHLRRRP